MQIPRTLMDEIDTRNEESFDAIARTLAAHTRRPSQLDFYERSRTAGLSPADLLEEFGGLQ